MTQPEDPDYIPEVEPFDFSYEAQLEEINQQSWKDLHDPTMTSDLITRKIRRPPWLFEDFLLSHTLTMISGEPFAGKSLCMMAMLAAIDSQEPLFGSYPVTGRQKALFIGQDSPTWDYYGQYQKLGRALQLPVERFNDSIMLLNKGFDILDPATLKIIEDGIDYFNITVLMLDTLLELHNLDENSNTEMKKVMGCLKHLRDKHSLSVFFTTHTSKSIEGRSANYRARGAGTISGSVDQHILISPHPEGGFKIKAPKARGGDKKAEAIYVKFAPSLINGEPALGLIHAEDLYREREQKILAVFADGKPHARKEVVAALHIAYPEWADDEVSQRTSNSLKFLVVKGSIRKLEWGTYEKTESPQPKGASNPA